MIIQGHIWWAKVLGEPVQNYSKDGHEWTFDVTLDEENKQKLLDAGVDESKIKTKDDERGDFITLGRNYEKRDGGTAKPIAVVDRNKNEWDSSVLIGNGSKVNVIVAINETTYKSKPWFKPSPIKIQVVDHVEVEQDELPSYDEDEFEDE